MGDIIVIGILVLAIGLAIVPTVKHFKGQGGCCGGGSYQPKKKKLGRVEAKRVFYVEGMHCEHCKNRVMEAVNDIPGVSARVNLKQGRVTVLYEKPVEDERIRKQIEKAGYAVR